MSSAEFRLHLLVNWMMKVESSLRILMLSKACLVGLYQGKLEEIAQQADVTALKVLVPPSWKDERGQMFLERAHLNGYELEVTPIRFNGNFHLHYYPHFEAAARAFQPDIIHIDEEPYNVATWLALRVARQIGAKTLFFSWQNIKRNYPLPFRMGEKWVLAHINYGLVGTQSAADVWRSKGYRGRLAVIPQFGIDPQTFSPRTQSPDHEPIRIGYIGRLVREKGVDLLLDALAKIPANWSLTLVGGGPEETRLKKQVQDLGITDTVTFRGQVPSMQMPDYYRELDVLVIPSRTLSNWKEQFGRVIIEAMASEVAVIGSDSGAIPDVIGEAGLIFCEDDLDDLCEKLKCLINNSDERKRLGQLGRERILANFTQAQVAEQTVAVYREMLASS
jgi:glycosyltransferase involved in cell wall biosynthesis